MTNVLAPILVSKRMIDILALESRIVSDKPNSALKAMPHVLKAYEIAANVYKRGGCSQGQMMSLESIVTKLTGISDGH